jgi:hypothetical protein
MAVYIHINRLKMIILTDTSTCTNNNTLKLVMLQPTIGVNFNQFV